MPAAGILEMVINLSTAARQLSINMSIHCVDFPAQCTVESFEEKS